jgi:ribonuclease BN (tRNA processing enzyme)
MTKFINEAIRRAISRRSFLQGMGSLATAPLLTGLGGSMLTGCSSTSSADTGSGGNVELVILGSSGGVAYWPGSTRASSSSALVVNGTIYLIDLGQGSTARLNQAFDSQSIVNKDGSYNPPYSSVFLNQVKALFFTHLHQDHIADYANLLLIGAGSNLGTTIDANGTTNGWAQRPLQVIGPCNRGQLDINKSPFFTDQQSNDWIIKAYSQNPLLVTPTPGTIQMTDLIWQAFAQSINDIMLDDGYPNYKSMVNVKEIGTQLPTQGANTCPQTPPFPVYEDENVRVTTTLVDHRQVYPAFAYRFDILDGSGRSVVFSGDTGPNTTADRTLDPSTQSFDNGNLQELAKGADVLVHEVIDSVWIDAKFGTNPNPASAAFTLKTHMQNAHTEVKYVGQVAANCQVKTLVLNHIIPGMAPLSHLQQAQQNFSGGLIISNDLMRIDVTNFGCRIIDPGMG